MKIPDFIRIGGVNYEVLTAPNVRMNNQLMCGLIDYNDLTITLSDTDGRNHQNQCITLWHEILHGIEQHMGLNIPSDIREEIIDAFARGIYMVLQDNGAALFDLEVKEK